MIIMIHGIEIRKKVIVRLLHVINLCVGHGNTTNYATNTSKHYDIIYDIFDTYINNDNNDALIINTYIIIVVIVITLNTFLLINTLYKTTFFMTLLAYLL